MWSPVASCSDAFTLSVLTLLLHLLANAKDLAVNTKDVGLRVRAWLRGKGSDLPAGLQKLDDRHAERVDMAMRHLVEKNFVFASCILQHSVCIALAVLLHLDGTRAIRVAAAIAYFLHLGVAHGYFKLSSDHIRVYLLVLCLIGVAESFETAHVDPSKMAVIQTLNTVFRVGMVVLHMEPRVHVLGQISVSASDVLIKLMVHGPISSVALHACVEGFVALGTVMLSISLDYYVRETLAAQFRSDDAETMVAGFRRMLRGICDGEVLLDGELKILGPGACLNQILSTNAVFHDKSFLELLAGKEEQTRLHNFLATSSQTCACPDVNSGMPQCLRVSLQGMSSMPVGVDLFHVSLSNLFGSGNTYHLLALRQDVESRPIPDARGEIPQQLLKQLSDRCRTGSTQGPASDSGTSGCSLVQTPQLSEIMLLIDTTKRQQNVSQVHLSYTEAADGGGVPTLRRFIRPTDWESMRARVKRYSQKAMADPALEPAYLSRAVWFRMLDDPRRYMLARKAKLSIRRSPGSLEDAGQREAVKIWLYLTDFGTPEPVAPSVELEGIQESED